MVGRESPSQLLEIFLVSGIADIEFARDVCAAVKDGRSPANHDEVHTFVVQTLKGKFKIHAFGLPALPRTLSAAWANTCMRRARSAVLSLICSISSVTSTPKACAASTFPPGIGFSKRSIARASPGPIACSGAPMGSV